MIDPKKIEELTRSLSGLLPPDIEALKEDFEKNARALIQSAFEKMDLVGRDEFDTQSALLTRTREKLEALEAQLSEIEKNLNK